MNYEKAYNKLKSFCESLYDGVYCGNCGANPKCTNSIEECPQCEKCTRKSMKWSFPKSTIKHIELERKQ